MATRTIAVPDPQLCIPCLYAFDAEDDRASREVVRESRNPPPGHPGEDQMICPACGKAGYIHPISIEQLYKLANDESITLGQGGGGTAGRNRAPGTGPAASQPPIAAPPAGDN